MNYIVNEGELKSVFNMGTDGEDFSFDNFLKSKQPIELVAEGEVFIDNDIDDEELDYPCLYIGDIPQEGLILRLSKYGGKSIKIYIVKE